MPVDGEERLIETTHLSYAAQPFLSAYKPSVTAIATLSLNAWSHCFTTCLRIQEVIYIVSCPCTELKPLQIHHYFYT